MSTENIQQDPVEQFLIENDETFMALPDIELEPHLLISKVRKHYMEYVIKLLSINYETNQKLLNKNIYLPSAIWRCAKNIETKAAQACMVVQLYRKNIVSVVNELKSDTKKGKLNRKLYECLNKPPSNDKKIQTACTNIKENNCQCGLMKRKKRNVMSISPKHTLNETHPELLVINDNFKSHQDNYSVQVSRNTQHSLLPLAKKINQPNAANTKTITTPPQLNHRASVESDPDELMIQLEKLFQGDQNDDDIFEGALCDRLDTALDDHTKKVTNIIMETSKINATQDAVIENHAAQIKSLDERLASLTGLLVASGDTTVPTQKIEDYRPKRSISSKWLCEEYFLKQKLYELLDQIGDNNRKHLNKIKEKFVYYFGYDSDDEGIISPLEETPEFIVSCKERIAPWVVKILTPYYIKGHIKGKGVFKSLAKHLIRLIYQCSKYPGKLVLAKWNNVRDSWLKTVKKQKDESKSGSSAKKTRNYLYQEQLMFLKKVSEPRPPHESGSKKTRTETEEGMESDFRSTLIKDKRTIDNKEVNEKMSKFLDSRMKSEKENHHLSFFKGIIPVLNTLTIEETLELQASVLTMLQKIKSRNYERPNYGHWRHYNQMTGPDQYTHSGYYTHPNQQATPTQDHHSGYTTKYNSSNQQATTPIPSTSSQSSNPNPGKPVSPTTSSTHSIYSQDSEYLDFEGF